MTVPVEHMLAFRYLLAETLSKNDRNSILRAFDISSGDDVILKSAPIQKKNQVSELQKQYSILSSLPPHPSIVQVVEVFRGDEQEYLSMKCAGTLNLFDYLKKFGPLDTNTARNLFRNLCDGVQHLHTHKVIHGDLKPENIVVKSSFMVVICDFASSSLWEEGKKFKVSRASFPYSAPELLKGSVKNGPAVDIWSLGVILYVVLLGHWPWTEGQWKRRNAEWRSRQEFSTQLNDLLSQMIEPVVEQRIQMNLVLAHEWMSLVDPDQLYYELDPVISTSSSTNVTSQESSSDLTQRKGRKRFFTLFGH